MADVPLMNNPMTTAGDVIYGGASGAPTRLAVGTAGQVLKVNSGATAVEWGAASGAAAIVGCALTHSADLDLATGSEQAIPFNTELWDTDGFHDTGSNQERVTIPTGLGGLYRVEMNGRWTANPGNAYVVCRKQTATPIILVLTNTSVASLTVYSFSGSQTVEMDAGDYFEFKQLITNNVDLNAGSDYGPIVVVTRIGDAPA